jgi:hypothetical protein
MMMPSLTLATTVERFSLVTHGLTEAQLELPWAWRAHDEEGVRFAFFITYHELRHLATHLAAGNPALTIAQRALAQHHRAFRDLQAVLLGVSDLIAVQPPAPEEWSVHTALCHILGAEAGFFARIQYAVERQRASDNRPLEMPDELLPQYNGLDDDTRARHKAAPLSEVWAWYAALHERVLNQLADIRDDEVQAPSQWWEGYEVPAEFRLHRFDAHLRQHTIQIEKTLAAIDFAPSEAHRLLRHIYDALAEAEGALLGAPDFAEAERAAAAQTIVARSDDIANVLSR